MDRSMTDTPMQNVKKTMFWLSIGMLVYFFCQWLMTIFIVRLTDYKVAGDFALVLTSSNVFAQIALFGMRPYQISDIRQQFSDKAYLTSRIFTCGLSVLAGAVFCLFSDFTIIQKICLLVYLIYRATEGGFDVLHGMLQNAGRIDIAGISLIVRGVVPLMLFCVVLALFKELLTALVVITLFSLIWMILFDYNRAKIFSVNRLITDERVQLKQLVSLLKDCFPLVVGNLVYSLILFVPRYYVEGIYGTNALGVYASVAAPATVVPLLAQYIYTPYMPIISEHYLKRRKRLLSRLIFKLTLAVTLVGGGMLLAGHLFGEWGLVLLFGESIREHSYLLVPILLSVVCTAFVYFLNAIIISIRRNNIMLISSVVAVILCFTLSYTLVKSDINGASFSMAAVQTAQATVLAIGGFLAIRRYGKTR